MAQASAQANLDTLGDTYPGDATVSKRRSGIRPKPNDQQPGHYRAKKKPATQQEYNDPKQGLKKHAPRQGQHKAKPGRFLQIYYHGPYQTWLVGQFALNSQFFQPLHQKWLISFGYGLNGLRWEYNPDPATWPANNSVFSLLYIMRQLDPTVVPLGVAGAYREDEPLPAHLADTHPTDHVYIGGPRYDNPSVPHPYHPGNQEIARINMQIGQASRAQIPHQPRFR